MTLWCAQDEGRYMAQPVGDEYVFAPNNPFMQVSMLFACCIVGCHLVKTSDLARLGLVSRIAAAALVAAHMAGMSLGCRAR